MTDKELLQMALDSLQRINLTGDTQVFDIYDAPIVIPALRTRLEQPERQWVGLTKAEFNEATNNLEDLEDCWIAIEAKLKEKNNG